MNAFQRWIQGRFVQIVTTIVAGSLFLLTAHSTNAPWLRHQDNQTPFADRLDTPPAIPERGPSGTVAAYQSPAESGTPSNGSLAINSTTTVGTLTGQPNWSHGMPYTCTLSFGSNSAAYTTFVNQFIDASACFSMNGSGSTLNKTKWSLIKAINNPTNNTAALTFLAQCPYGSNHTVGSAVAHTGDPQGSGRIIVISMSAGIDSSGNASNLYFNYHGTFGSILEQ